MEWKRLIEERNAWVAKNFPNPHIPDPGESILGCIEELGELAHAHLKKAQNIRGDAEQHDVDAKDAVGDLTVYLLGVMAKVGPPAVRSVPSTPTEAHTLFKLATCVGALAKRKSRYDVEQIVGTLERYCFQRGWDYEEVVNQVWKKVKQRDWTKDPQAGGENEAIQTKPETIEDQTVEEQLGRRHPDFG